MIIKCTVTYDSKIMLSGCMIHDILSTVIADDIVIKYFSYTSTLNCNDLCNEYLRNNFRLYYDICIDE